MNFSARGGEIFYFPQVTVEPPPPSTSQILLEDNDNLLLEDAGLILLES